MDEVCSRAVRHAFVKLFQKGLIYRGRRMVNWCPRDNTALADIEVEHEERAGKLWYIRYPLATGSGHMVVATTRPGKQWEVGREIRRRVKVRFDKDGIVMPQRGIQLGDAQLLTQLLGARGETKVDPRP